MSDTKLFKVSSFNRMDVTDKHYTVNGGLTAEEVKEKLGISEEDLKDFIETGEGCFKDGVFEYEVSLEKKPVKKDKSYNWHRLWDAVDKAIKVWKNAE